MNLSPLQQSRQTKLLVKITTIYIISQNGGETMRIENVRLDMMKAITLSDINDESKNKLERAYLHEQQKRLLVERDKLVKAVAAMIGELTFYYFELNRIDERLEDLEEINRGDDNAKDA